MFIPLHDANSLKHIRLQYVTLGLIAANVLVYALVNIGGSHLEAAVLGFGFIPALVHDLATLPAPYEVIPADFSYVTYAFLHADIFHLGGNMLFLWVFGDNVEDALGHLKFLLFYLLCAAAGAFLHGVIIPQSEAPLIGASGAIAGIVAAYLLLHPRVKVWVLAFGRIPLRIPALYPLLLWIAAQFLMLFWKGDEQVSWPAHVGGIVAGALLTLVLKRRNVPLLDREVVSPKAVISAPVEDSAAVPPEPVKWGR
ncbi:rhomboid family intramembrane serine protease [Phyllobacterium sp. 0TCS1.6C]|uniref:rhomboid family intramembrane serine protease n=1 Tax=unclassified Phyllobacterium TaxID=2638441 RepID=UPI002264AF64|nr:MULTISPECIES: rhomboid family intramembrane serine protease [unclassified Phyllobacterium]MCX8281566.1 rhomboid family intramembrane serine protease [Phyllobacterium sp. 0TCS1.6C]MCX8292838.1 rhomboid family intramembrane serine protease [Phyllobacterium sp. 0TCS1.6A]